MTPTYPQPAWRRELIHANQRKAKLATCPCGQPILVGLDNDQCAFTANADPYFLTWAGEIAAHALESRRTYWLQAGTLIRRDHPTHSSETTLPILAQHRCGQPIPNNWRKQLTPVTRREDSNEPPF